MVVAVVDEEVDDEEDMNLLPTLLLQNELSCPLSPFSTSRRDDRDLDRRVDRGDIRRALSSSSLPSHASTSDGMSSLLLLSTSMSRLAMAWAFTRRRCSLLKLRISDTE